MNKLIVFLAVFCTLSDHYLAQGRSGELKIKVERNEVGTSMFGNFPNCEACAVQMKQFAKNEYQALKKHASSFIYNILEL
ncbi:hypothetical protein NPIL_581331 [Nephila pilipes]|uniref:Uncharacterized protein n=1 Tax=Nephila pilipes TaxID=299642 RepID=A0A8X6QFR9_NEPPI|nr:hypothetical protein NPIL_581331 [Nephila pilipes]